MLGIIGKKIGMTSVFDEDGKSLPCTVIQAGPCVVTQLKTIEKDGYNAVQLSFDEKKPKHTSAALKGHFAKSNTTPKRKLAEIKNFREEKKMGDSVTVNIFNKDEYVDVVGYSKGKGFQGVIKRHHFSGVGMNSHGQHDRVRAPGSVGNSSFAARVVKGMRMGGRTGNNRIKVQNLRVVEINKENNLLFVNGAVPGSNGSYVIIEK